MKNIRKEKNKFFLPILAVGVCILALAVVFLRTNRWVKYNSKCSGLSEVSIYYPTGWKPGMDGEDKISDGYEDTVEGKKEYGSQCLVLFGYPKAPGGRQDSYVSGQESEIRVQGENLPVAGTADLDQYVASYVNNADAVILDDKHINGKDWKVLKFNDGEIYWVTSSKGKVYNVSFRDWSGSLTTKIAEEMVQKIQFK